MTYFSFFSLPNYPPNSPPTQKNYVVVCDQWCLCCFNFTKNSSKLQWCVLHILVDQSSYADRLKNRQPTDMTGNNIFNIFAIFPPKIIIFQIYAYYLQKRFWTRMRFVLNFDAVIYYKDTSLFRKRRFVLNFLFQWNSSKFNFEFYLKNVLVCVDIGIHKIKLKVAWNEKRKKTAWVFLYIQYGKFWSVSPEQKIERKPLFSEEWHRYNFQ